MYSHTHKIPDFPHSLGVRTISRRLLNIILCGGVFFASPCLRRRNIYYLCVSLGVSTFAVSSSRSNFNVTAVRRTHHLMPPINCNNDRIVSVHHGCYTMSLSISISHFLCVFFFVAYFCTSGRAHFFELA